MSDNDKKDLTRIEDLSEFLHSEDDDDLSDIEAALSSDDSPPEIPSGADDFAEMATDPDMQVPDGLNDDSAQDTDFAALEDQEEDFNSDSEEPDFADDSTDFGGDDNTDFGGDDNTDFGGDDSTDFGGDDNTDFGGDDESDFGGDDESDFGGDDESDFGGEVESDFGGDDNTDFGGEDNTDFGNDDNTDFGNDDNTDFGSDESFDEVPDISPSSDEILFEQTAQFLQTPELSEIQSELQTPPIPDDNDPLDKEEDLSETSFGDSNKTPLPVMEESSAYKAPENFKELQQFARNMSYGNMAKEGNPPFSIILKDIKFEEDLEDIVRLLIEFNVIDEAERENATNSLRRGSMLIPRLGEFAAISLCHKLRRFDINILMGLTEEVSPAKDYESHDRGLATKHNIYNNKQHSWRFEKADVGLQDIIVTTTPYIEGHDIVDYISVVTESTIIDMADFTNEKTLEEEIKIEINKEGKSKKDFYPINNEVDESKSTLNDLYRSLVEKCKGHTLNSKGNALVGINFQITPLIIDDPIHVHSRYQITCSGSVVWISKR